MFPRDECESHSIWVSAYLLVHGCEIIRVVPNGPRRSIFVHKNPDNKAFALTSEWRYGVDATVNGPAFVDAYRKVLHLARQAEDEESYYNENSQGGNNNGQYRKA